MSGGVFLTAAWRRLAMVSFEVDPGLLEPFVPRGTALDRFRGRAFVSLVGFRFLETRVKGIPIPFHRSFDEVNLRFYVRREHPDGARRGVVFIKEIVPRRAIAWVARWVYGESYVAMPMRHDLGARHTAYFFRPGATWCGLGVDHPDAYEEPADGSEESFITEHYWGYAAARSGATVEYRVEHPRWRVARGAARALTGDLRPVYGAALTEAISGEASSAFVADGSPVVVREGRRLRA